MTLILTSVTPEYVVMASDRRLSSSGVIQTDESGKAGFVQAFDGIALYAYTGLARLGRFEARKWIQDALLEAGDGTLKETLFRFSAVAERKFQNLAYRGQGITLALAGFGTEGQFFGSVSNLEDHDGGFLPEPAPKFSCRLLISPASKPLSLSGVGANGFNQTNYANELHELNRLVLKNVPSNGIAQKSIHLIRQLSDDPRTGGTVGKSVMVSTLTKPRGFEMSTPSARYSPFQSRDRLHLLDMVDIRPTDGIAMHGIELEFQPNNSKLGRNEHCYCGSGQKFKRCHGAAA